MKSGLKSENRLYEYCMSLLIYSEYSNLKIDYMNTVWNTTYTKNNVQKFEIFIEFEKEELEMKDIQISDD